MTHLYNHIHTQALNGIIHKFMILSETLFRLLFSQIFYFNQDAINQESL